MGGNAYHNITLLSRSARSIVVFAKVTKVIYLLVIVVISSAIVQWLVSPPVTRETGVRFPVAEVIFVRCGFKMWASIVLLYLHQSHSKQSPWYYFVLASSNNNKQTLDNIVCLVSPPVTRETGAGSIPRRGDFFVRCGFKMWASLVLLSLHQSHNNQSPCGILFLPPPTTTSKHLIIYYSIIINNGECLLLQSEIDCRVSKITKVICLLVTKVRKLRVSAFKGYSGVCVCLASG